MAPLRSSPMAAENRYRPVVELASARIVGFFASDVPVATAVAQLAAWQAEFARVPSLWLGHTNVDLASVVAEEGPPAHDLVLALPVGEVPIGRTDARVRRAIEAAPAAGVRVALTGFGAPGSSLAQLRRFPFDMVEIDPTVVASLPASPQAQLVVEAVRELAWTRGQVMLAGGVSREPQARLLSAAGCELAWGDLWSSHLSAHECRAALADVRAGAGCGRV